MVFKRLKLLASRLKKATIYTMPALPAVVTGADPLVSEADKLDFKALLLYQNPSLLLGPV